MGLHLIKTQPQWLTPPDGRIKDQKFGILDAPFLLHDDLERPAGVLGRVVIYLDIDDFKAVNTRFTERIVDRTVLPELQRMVQRAAHTIGHAYAEGGDEMVIHLPNATAEMGLSLAHALRARIAEHPFRVQGDEINLTTSFGVAWSTTLGGEELADLACVAKHRAKKAGKNCVILHAP